MLDDNLCGLNFQLQNPLVKNITEVLLHTHSTYVRQFLALKDEIETGVKEAKSNIEFLRVVETDSMKLTKCIYPSCIGKHLMKTIHLFRTIWLNSPYYSSQERIENLFKALSNQIIVICRDYVDLQEFFAGKTRKSIKKFKECIDACNNYKTVYQQVTSFFLMIFLFVYSWLLF